jgi:hypothetical protein
MARNKKQITKHITCCNVGAIHKEDAEYMVSIMLSPTYVKNFRNWIYGQTGPVLDCGCFALYIYDVVRYIQSQITGTPTVWD